MIKRIFKKVWDRMPFVGQIENWKALKGSINGAAGRIRTCDHLVRSQILYPAELQPQMKCDRNLKWCGWQESNLRPPGS